MSETPSRASVPAGSMGAWVRCSRSTSALPRAAAWADIGRTSIDKVPATGPVAVDAARAGRRPGVRPPPPRRPGAGGLRVRPRGPRPVGRGARRRASADGQFGENLTTAGIDVNEAELGERWRIGDTVVLEVASIRTPCSDFKAWMGRCGYDETAWVKRFAAEARPGPYLRVLVPGDDPRPATRSRSSTSPVTASRCRWRSGHCLHDRTLLPAARRRPGPDAEDPRPGSTSYLGRGPVIGGLARPVAARRPRRPPDGGRHPGQHHRQRHLLHALGALLHADRRVLGRAGRHRPLDRGRRRRSWPASRSATSPTGSALARCRCAVRRLDRGRRRALPARAVVVAVRAAGHGGGGARPRLGRRAVRR